MEGQELFEPPPIPSLEEVLQQEELQRRRTNQAHRVLTQDEVKTLKQKLRAASYHHGGSDLAALFESSDKDRSGYLDLQELSILVKKLIPHVTREEMKHLFDTLDVDKSGTIDKNEFVAFVTESDRKSTSFSSSSLDTVSPSPTTSAWTGTVADHKVGSGGSGKPRQPSASSIELQQASYEKELLLKEVVSLRDQLQQLERQHTFGDGERKLNRFTQNSEVNDDQKLEIVLNNNIKLSTSVCMWCLKYFVLKMKSRAFRQWCVVTTEARLENIQCSPSRDDGANNSGSKKFSQHNGVDLEVQDGQMDKKRRELLVSAKKIIGGRSELLANDDEDEKTRRSLNQSGTHPTSFELENLKYKITTASYDLGRTDLRTFFDRVDKDRSGAIDLLELLHAIKKLVPSITKQQITYLFHLMDANGDGVIQRNEFIAFMTNRQSPSPNARRSPKSPRASRDCHELLTHEQVKTNGVKTATQFSPQTKSSKFHHMEAPTQSFSNSQHFSPDSNGSPTSKHERKISAVNSKSLDRFVVPTSASLKKLNAKVMTNASDKFFFSQSLNTDTDNVGDVGVGNNESDSEISLVPDIRKAIDEIKLLATSKNSKANSHNVDDPPNSSSSPAIAVDRNAIVSITTEDYLSPPEDTQDTLCDPLPGNKKKSRPIIDSTSLYNTSNRPRRTLLDEKNDAKEEMRRKSGQTSVNFSSKELELLKHRIIAASYRVGKADLNGLFDRMDKDHSGELDYDELAYSLKRLLPTVTREQLTNFLHAIDEDCNGSVSKEEFIAFLSHRKSEEHVYKNVAYGTPGYINPHGKVADKKIEKAQLRLLKGPPLPVKTSPKFKFKGLL